MREIGLIPGARVTVLGKPQGAKVHLRVEKEEHLLEAARCQEIIVKRD